MKKNLKHNGFAIAIAWPETFCKQPGAWYDPITLFLGINNNHYYRVGHAALVLIDGEKNRCQYFDFGRYHTPFQHGRVRSSETDFDLKIKTSPIISDDRKSLTNYIDILTELQNNPACHGEGELNASYCTINFQKAITKIKQMQKNSPLPYGPFKIDGSNCSRFVNTSILSGNPYWKNRMKLKYFVPLSPTPMSNVKALDNKIKLKKILKHTPFYPFKPLEKNMLSAALPAPKRNSKIPENAQWLSGEGAGSWFIFNAQTKGLNVTRYSPDGNIECNGLFKNTNDLMLLNHSNLKVTYPSNCMEFTLINDEKTVKFQRILP